MTSKWKVTYMKGGAELTSFTIYLEDHQSNAFEIGREIDKVIPYEPASNILSIIQLPQVK